MTIRILQFGTSGQLGIELLRQAPAHDVALTALSRADADLADSAVCAEKVAEQRPDLVVIAAAYTAVDLAESERDLALRVNGQTPAAIARAAHAAGAPVIYVSSDYVFAGDKPGAYVEDDPIAPAGSYGASKAYGEQAVLEGATNALVLRTSWVVSAHGKNFVKTMLRLAKERKPLRVVDDQLGRPTSAADLAGFILDQAPGLAAARGDDSRWGVCHFANAGAVTWRRFAEAIVRDALGAAAPIVTPITTAEFPTPARRPANSVLDTGRLEAVFGYRPRPWRDALGDILAELKVAA